MVLGLDQYGEERASSAWTVILFQTSASCHWRLCSCQWQSHTHRQTCHCWKTMHLWVLIRKPKHHPPEDHSCSLPRVDMSSLTFHPQKCWNSVHSWHFWRWKPETRYQETLDSLQTASWGALAPRKGQEEFHPTKTVLLESHLPEDQQLSMQIWLHSAVWCWLACQIRQRTRKSWWSLFSCRFQCLELLSWMEASQRP